MSAPSDPGSVPGTGTPPPCGEDLRECVPRGLRAEILRVATDSFADKGFSKTSIRELVEACGCTKPALYYYFANKNELYREAVRAQFENMTAMISATLLGDGPLRVRVRNGTESFVEFVKSNPSAMRLLWRLDLDIRSQSEEVVREFVGARELHMRFMRDMFQQGIERGEVRAQVDPRDCAVALAGTVDFHIQLWMQGDPAAFDRLRPTLDLLFDGISER